MPTPTRILDVWIVDTDTVYREVPFTVVADWLQQGRLLGNDQIRLAGKQAWHRIDKVTAFAPYFPREEPLAANDEAEALEPVDLGWSYHAPEESEDDDVDMIPLIDISLVLLIFFMMTASINTNIVSPIQTPGAKYQLAAISKGQFWVGIDTKGREPAPAAAGQPWYSLGLDQKELLAPTRNLDEVVGMLGTQLEAIQGEVRLRLRADRTLPIEVIRAATQRLQELESAFNAKREPAHAMKFTIQGEVSEPNK